jgi:hypothetical protein
MHSVLLALVFVFFLIMPTAIGVLGRHRKRMFPS